jgi:hypothetical protein
MANDDASFKKRAVFVRLSEIEYRQVVREAARRGITVADLTRSLFRVASGSLPVPATRDTTGSTG